MTNTEWLEQIDNERETMLAASPKCDDCGQAVKEGESLCDPCLTLANAADQDWDEFVGQDDPIDTYGMDYPMMEYE